MKTASPLCAIAAAAAVLAGCGGGSDAGKGSAPEGVLPPCAEPGPRIELPADFPRSFPLPQGTVFDRKRRQAERFTVLDGFVPGELDETRSYFLDALPKAGFPLGEGDAEEHEAETEFTGHGMEGHLKIHDIPDCEGALTLQVIVSEG